MNAALFFLPEAYSADGPKLMGRNAAGESFLRAFLTYSQSSEFWIHIQDQAHAHEFARKARRAGRQEPIQAVDANSLGALSQIGASYFPGPDIGTLAWQRAAYGHGAWSLTGITHTTSSATVMDAIAGWLTAPVQPWDAVICTSTAVKNNVECLLQAQADFLVQRLGAQRLVLPQLPVIPLGVHCNDFVFDETLRAAARSTFGFDGRTHVVLFLGRLSFHAKAHPLAMYQALEKAAKLIPDGDRIVLIECGWHGNEAVADAYREAAALACPSVSVVILDGRLPENRQLAWASADVFCSLSDNIQETFGISPIEAMATGLPVVVSDWDGYKDTVRHEVDGFRVPSLMPGAGLGGDLALRHAAAVDSYDRYCGYTASFVAVDVEVTAQAFIRLFNSPELRRQMGSAGQQRAKAVYDWVKIIPQYEDLWAQLAEIRAAQSQNLKPLPHPWPARMDPFHGFAAYPTETLEPHTVLGLVDTDAHTAIMRTLAYRQLAMIDFAKVVLPREQELQAVLSAAASEPKAAVELIASIPTERQPFVLRSLAWLLKMGVLKVCS